MHNAEQMIGRPSNRQTVKRSNPIMRTEPHRGSVLMEAVLCLPLLLCLVSGIIQFARLWEARFFTWLAAYNGARAALVYNERDYAGMVTVTNVVASGAKPKWYHVGKRLRKIDIQVVEKEQFYRDKGIVWLAAVNTLAWMSETDDSDALFFPTMGHVPHSSRIREQVEIVPESPTGKADDMRFSEEKTGYVRVCVAFKFPLIFSVFDPSVLWRAPKDGPSPMADLTGVEPDNAAARREGGLGRTFTLYETVLLPKPWTTKYYPLLSKAERRHLLEAEGVAATSEIPHWWDNE